MLNLLDIFFKNIQISNFIKICPVGTEMYQVDGWTDRHGKANSSFSQFCKHAQKLDIQSFYYSPTGRRNHGRPLKRLLDTWDQNRSTSGPTPWKIDDDDDDDDDDNDDDKVFKPFIDVWCYYTNNTHFLSQTFHDIWMTYTSSCLCG